MVSEESWTSKTPNKAVKYRRIKILKKNERPKGVKTIEPARFGRIGGKLKIQKREK